MLTIYNNILQICFILLLFCKVLTDSNFLCIFVVDLGNTLFLRVARIAIAI